jgi:hypothetical protein
MLIEHLLEPGSTALPDCRCGKQMKIFSYSPLSHRNGATIRIYRCAACNHEMRLTVWLDNPAQRL